MEVCLIGWKYLKVFGIVDMKSLYVDFTMLAPITSQQMDEQVTPNGSHLPVVTLLNVNQCIGLESSGLVAGSQGKTFQKYFL